MNHAKAKFVQIKYTVNVNVIPTENTVVTTSQWANCSDFLATYCQINIIDGLLKNTVGLPFFNFISKEFPPINFAFILQHIQYLDQLKNKT